MLPSSIQNPTRSYYGMCWWHILFYLRLPTPSGNNSNMVKMDPHLKTIIQLQGCCTTMIISPEYNGCTLVHSTSGGIWDCSLGGKEKSSPSLHRARASPAAKWIYTCKQSRHWKLKSCKNVKHNKIERHRPQTVNKCENTHLPVRTERFWPRNRRRFWGPWSQIHVEAHCSAVLARVSSHT